MDATLKSLQHQGQVPTQEDIARLSPFGHKHINYLGHYMLSHPETIRDGRLRAFRAPGHLSDLEDD